MQKQTQKALVTLGIAMQLGFSIAIPLIVFIALGIWADKSFGTMPLLTIAGVLLSLVVSVAEIFQIIKSVQQGSGRSDGKRM